MQFLVILFYPDRLQGRSETKAQKSSILSLIHVDLT